MTSQLDFARPADPAGATSANPVATAVSDDALLRAIVDVRAAFARAHAKVTRPELVAEAIGDATELERLDLPALSAAVLDAGNPAAALVHAAHRIGGRLDRSAAVRDIFDSGTLLVAQRAVPIIRQEVRRVECAVDQLAQPGLAIGRWLRVLNDADRRLGRFMADGPPVALDGLAGDMVGGMVDGIGPCRTDEPAPEGTHTLAGFLEFPATDAPASPPAERGTHTLSGHLPHLPDGDVRACLDELAAAFAAESGLAAPSPPWQTPHGRLADLAVALTLAASALQKMADAAWSTTASPAPSARARALAARVRRTAGRVPAVGADLLRCVAADDERPPDTWHARWRLLRDCLLLSGSAVHDGRQLARDLS